MFLAAVAAGAAKLNAELGDFKIELADAGKVECVKSLVFHIDDPVAVQANQMMVLPGVAIKPGSRSRMAGLGDDADAHQHVEHTVHGRSRDTGNSPAHVLVDLVGCRMIVASQDGFEHDPPLNSQGQPLVVTNRLEPKHRILFGEWMLFHAGW